MESNDPESAQIGAIPKVIKGRLFIPKRYKKHLYFLVEWAIISLMNEVNKELVMNKRLDLGNNESVVSGVFRNEDGTYTAMTFTKSKTFKTEAGANRWLANQTQSN